MTTPDTATPLYDDDILVWSERQAAILRDLARNRRDLPNDFDAENVAEEIESVGRSETGAVESFLRQLLIHLIKLASAPAAPAAAHWRDEARNFRAEALTRFAASMRERVDLGRAWRLAREQATASLAEHGDPVVNLPEDCPFSIEELVREPLDLGSLLARISSGPSLPDQD